MTNDQAIIAAVRLGHQTSAEIAAQLRMSQNAITANLANLTRAGLLWRTPGSPVSHRNYYRYRLMDAPDVLEERRARVERMRGWAPAALAEMRRAS